MQGSHNRNKKKFRSLSLCYFLFEMCIVEALFKEKVGDYQTFSIQNICSNSSLQEQHYKNISVRYFSQNYFSKLQLISPLSLFLINSILEYRCNPCHTLCIVGNSR
jgi:hypothetical protein